MEISIGFLGFGEVGYFMSKGLRKEGLTTMLAFDNAYLAGGVVADSISFRAQENNVKLCHALEEMLTKVNIVIAAVPAKFAFSAAEATLKFKSKIRLYADVSTAKPSVKKQMEALFAAQDIKFVDSAMLGPLPNYHHKVPILASGEGAENWRAIMTPWGMKIQTIAGPAGTASSIKLIRSVFMKGLEALLVETFLFARKCGAEKIVLESLAETLKPPFQHTANRMMAADLVHSERRVFEVSESVELMNDIGVEPIMAQAVIGRLKKSAALGMREDLGGIPPETLAEVYEFWDSRGLF